VTDDEKVDASLARRIRERVARRDAEDSRRSFLRDFWGTPKPDVNTMARACGISPDQAYDWLVPHGRYA